MQRTLGDSALRKLRENPVLEGHIKSPFKIDIPWRDCLADDRYGSMSHTVMVEHPASNTCYLIKVHKQAFQRSHQMPCDNSWTIYFKRTTESIGRGNWCVPAFANQTSLFEVNRSSVAPLTSSITHYRRSPLCFEMLLLELRSIIVRREKRF